MFEGTIDVLIDKLNDFELGEQNSSRPDSVVSRDSLRSIFMVRANGNVRWTRCLTFRPRTFPQIDTRGRYTGMFLVVDTDASSAATSLFGLGTPAFRCVPHLYLYTGK